jgi:hypothetical protein
MRQRTIIGFLGVVTAFTLGVSLVVLLHQKTNTKQEVTELPVTPTPTLLALQPPTGALTGTILSTTGAVDRIPWDSPDSFVASKGATLFQEDEIITKAGSGAYISIPGVVYFSLLEDTDVLLGSLLPDKLAFKLKKGTITYQIETGQPAPVSIRCLSGLLEITSGTGTIQIFNGMVTISVASGQAKLASVDSTNTTRVYLLQAKENATIHGNTGNIRTTGKEIITNEEL